MSSQYANLNNGTILIQDEGINVAPAATLNFVGSGVVATDAGNGTVQVSIAGGGGGSVTQVDTGTGLTGGPITTTGTISLANTTVTPGSYTNTNLTVDAQGRITAAASGSSGLSFPLLAPDGSAVAPSYAFSTNPGVGLYYTNSPVAINVTISSTDAYRLTASAILPVGGKDLGEQGTPWSTIWANDINSLNNIRIYDTSFNVMITAPTLAASYTLTLPTTDGNAGQFLQTDGTGILSWAAGGASFPLLAPDGSATAPSYSFSNDTNTGFWLAGAGNMVATINGDNITQWITGALVPSDPSITLGASGNSWGNVFGLIFSIRTGGESRYYNAANTFYAAIKAPALAATYTLTLPVDDGTASQVLTTDGAGVLSWSSPAAPGANTALSNLTTTAINEDFIFDTGTTATVQTKNETGNTEALSIKTGATSSTVTDEKSGGILIETGNSSGTHSPDGDIQTGSIGINSGTAINGFSGNVSLGTGASEYQSGDTLIQTGAGLVADDAWSGDILLFTGNVTGTAESGNIKLGAGTAGANTLRGDIELDMYRLLVPQTITAGGTTGAQTIDKISGTVNFASATSTLVVTNNTVSTSSIVFAVIRTDDASATIKNVVPAAGSFTITLTAATTAETSVGFFVLN